jgi:hypothetical protein
MPTPVDFMKSLAEVRDLETIPMTRGQLVQLLIRLHIAEGMNYSQAQIHARTMVDATFVHLKSGA